MSLARELVQRRASHSNRDEELARRPRIEITAEN
jgi:hypothetical protein